jgi:hypothetical protein
MTTKTRVLKAGFELTRLPLSVAEKAAERAGFDLSKLPPVALYDSVEAQAKLLFGRMLADDQLVEEGLAQEEAVRRRLSASRLEAGAEEVRRSASEHLADRVESAENARQRARAEAGSAKARARREETAAKREAREKAAAREKAVRDAARTREKAVEAKAREAELARIEAEAKALEKRQKAVDAERVVTAIDGNLNGS